MITLAVDDRLDHAKQTADVMNEIDPQGYHMAACEQETALNYIRVHKPDIVWLDVEMPGLDGLSMAREVRTISPATNIVFVTGFRKYAVDAFGMHASGYVMKPVTRDRLQEEIDNLRSPVRQHDKEKIYIQCFGKFEVFYRGKLVRFRRALAKEALAYLVDRRGAGCTVSEICSVLWEDRQADTNLKSQCRVVLTALKRDLSAVGAGDVIVKMWNTWGIDTSRVTCDYYDFLREESNAVNNFRGEYMSQYSWAEMTTGSLYEMSSDEIRI